MRELVYGRYTIQPWDSNAGSLTSLSYLTHLTQYMHSNTISFSHYCFSHVIVGLWAGGSPRLENHAISLCLICHPGLACPLHGQGHQKDHLEVSLQALNKLQVSDGLLHGRIMFSNPWGAMTRIPDVLGSLTRAHFSGVGPYHWRSVLATREQGCGHPSRPAVESVHLALKPGAVAHS